MREGKGCGGINSHLNTCYLWFCSYNTKNQWGSCRYSAYSLSFPFSLWYKNANACFAYLMRRLYTQIYITIHVCVCVCVWEYMKNSFCYPQLHQHNGPRRSTRYPHSSRALRKTTHDKIPSARKGKYCEQCSLRMPVYPVIVRAGSMRCLLGGSWQL